MEVPNIINAASMLCIFHAVINGVIDGYIGFTILSVYFACQ